MSDSPKREPRANASADGASVLAGLPRARPQRASPRRAAARAAGMRRAPGETLEKTLGKTASKTAAKVPRKAAGKQAPKKRARASRAAEPVPRQGYESEGESLNGSVQPPGGSELVASAAELAGELAKASVTTGARLLKDFLSRLPPG